MKDTTTSINRRHARVRARVTGTTERPRLSAKVTLKHITAQVIDDTKGHTIAYVTTVGQKEAKGTMTERAAWVGERIAEQAQAKKVTKVSFDRGGRQYHGRLHALAESARQKGLEF